MSQIQDFNTLWMRVAALRVLMYNPTLAIANSLAFHNIPDATRDFPTLRVPGTIGWIAAGMSIDIVLPHGAANTNKPLLMAAVLSGALGVFSFMLPHTPPSGKKGGAMPFLRAFISAGDPGFAIFFTISLVIIRLHWRFITRLRGPFLRSLGVTAIGSTMSVGQWSEIDRCWLCRSH